MTGQNGNVIRNAMLYGAILGSSLFAGDKAANAGAYEGFLADSASTSSYAGENEDYSSYMQSLNNYCRNYGYTAPSVGGNDYNSAYSAWKYVDAQWRAENASGEDSKGEQFFDIVPLTYPDGSVIFRDRYGHGEIDALKQANGFYRLTGSEKLITKIGGRGEFDTIIRHLSDGNYFNDGKSD